MTVTDAQVRKLMEVLTKHGNLGLAAVKAGTDRKTARKYRDAGAFPSELKKPRGWRTREDPFEEDWPAFAEQLAEAPELEAKTLFGKLQAHRVPRADEVGPLTTLERAPTRGSRDRC